MMKTATTSIWGLSSDDSRANIDCPAQLGRNSRIKGHFYRVGDRHTFRVTYRECLFIVIIICSDHERTTFETCVVRYAKLLASPHEKL
jgi:hypothetical protein